MSDSSPRLRPTPRAWYRRPWFTWVVVLVIAIIFVAILVFPVAAQDSVSYCTSCKAMKPAEKTWSQGAHKDVSCTSCHIPPGLVASARWRYNEARNVWADYLGMNGISDRGHLPTNANCLSCHPLKDIPNEQNGVRMNHAEHLKLRGLLCSDCHNTVSHKKEGQTDGVSMVTCAMCHNEQGAPDQCDFCHVAPPPSQHAPDFMKEHGRRALLNEADCVRCHHDKQSFCDSCHAVPPPSHYSGRWRYTHGRDAAKDPQSCEACHDKAYCNECHQVNHPATWLQDHGAIAKQGPSACLVCHPQGMCDACHEQSGVTQ